MTKAKVWVDNDNLYLYVEVETNGDIVSFDEWGKPFTKEYVEKIISHHFGNIEIQFM